MIGTRRADAHDGQEPHHGSPPQAEYMRASGFLPSSQDTLLLTSGRSPYMRLPGREYVASLAWCRSLRSKPLDHCPPRVVPGRQASRTLRAYEKCFSK